MGIQFKKSGLSAVDLKRIKWAHDVCFAACSPVRFKIIERLRRYPNGQTVTQLAKKLHCSLSRISHQLAILRKNKVAVIEKIGREKIYKIPDANFKKYLPCWSLHLIK